MNKKNFGFILFAAAVLLLLVVLSSGKKPPLIPNDAAHAVVTTDAGCSACHAPGKAAMLKPSHPPKEQCLYCHKRKA
jgi:hypothetical protein